MIMFILFLCFGSMLVRTAEIDKDFMLMRQHVENCSINCANSACIQKEKNISDEWSKQLFKNVYRTYHCLSEIDAQKYGLDQNFRYFINFYGEALSCKRSATTKKDLVLFKRQSFYERDRREIDSTLSSLLHKKGCDQLDKLRAPHFEIMQKPNVKMAQECNEDLFIDLCCCAPECPLELIQMIHDRVVGPPEDKYLYYFFNTQGLSVYRADKKNFLFCIVNITKIANKFKKWQKNKESLPSLDYRYFSVDNIFRITQFHTDIDFYSNGGNRIVMLGEYEHMKKNGWFSTKKQTSILLMHIPNRYESRRCLEEDGYHPYFFVRTYTIDDVKKNHEKLVQGHTGEWHDRLPINCYHPQIITGSAQEITNYLCVALKRIAIGTSCLYKNDAASSLDCKVYNNPFGEFVVQSKGKPIVLDSSAVRTSSPLYYAVHNGEDVCDEQKMMQLAQKYAQQWKLTTDGQFLYYWEENPQGSCAKIWPYGDEYDWGGRGGYYRYDGYKDFYSWYHQDADADLRNNFESFSKYRLWILPLQDYKIFREKDSQKSLFQQAACGRAVTLNFSMIHTDWPYNITSASDNDILTLEHEQSDYILELDISKRPCGQDRYARVYFPDQVLVDYRGQPLAEQYKDPAACLRLTYEYKDPKKRDAFKKRRQERDEQKKRAEQEKKDAEERTQKIRMGLLPAANTVASDQAPQIDIPVVPNQPVDKRYFNILRPYLKIYGLPIVKGFALGGICVGIFWCLQNYKIAGSKTPKHAT